MSLYHIQSDSLLCNNGSYFPIVNGDESLNHVISPWELHSKNFLFSLLPDIASEYLISSKSNRFMNPQIKDTPLPSALLAVDLT